MRFEFLVVFVMAYSDSSGHTYFPVIDAALYAEILLTPTELYDDIKQYTGNPLCQFVFPLHFLHTIQQPVLMHNDSSWLVCNTS